MNPTLQKFDYPHALVREYASWVVLVRPVQVTAACAVIASKSSCTTLGDLAAHEAAELPLVIRDFEAAVRRLANVARAFRARDPAIVEDRPREEAERAEAA